MCFTPLPGAVSLTGMQSITPQLKTNLKAAALNVNNL
jgi:hypothetical protein